MTGPAMKSCDGGCAGSGLIPRLRRRFKNDDGTDGDVDPSDIIGQSKQLCPKCGGAGEILAGPITVAETRKGYAADLLG